MARRSGAAIVLSVASGEVLAAYHPDVAAKRIALPGSAIKPFVLLELLRSGKVTPETERVCRRKVQVGGHDLDCQHVRTVEAMNAERALAYSCNSYFTEMGARLTGTELVDAFRQTGFGAPTHLVARESFGALRPANTLDSVKLMAVGEYGILVTPLQMAAAYRRLVANAADAPTQTILAGLRQAVEYGTAQGARAPGQVVAGKTGTSTASEGAWTHAWFAGFAPTAKPPVVIVIFLERGHGSEAAAIAGQVFTHLSSRVGRP